MKSLNPVSLISVRDQEKSSPQVEATFPQSLFERELPFSILRFASCCMSNPDPRIRPPRWRRGLLTCELLNSDMIWYVLEVWSSEHQELKAVNCLNSLRSRFFPTTYANMNIYPCSPNMWKPNWVPATSPVQFPIFFICFQACLLRMISLMQEVKCLKMTLGLWRYTLLRRYVSLFTGLYVGAFLFSSTQAQEYSNWRDLLTDHDAASSLRFD